VEGGRIEAHHPREQLREEPLGVAQEGTLALGAPKLLQEGEGKHLGVREPLERCVAVAPRVEDTVGVVHEAEQHGHGLFQAGRPWGSVGVGHPRFLSPGIRMAPVLQANRATLI